VTKVRKKLILTILMFLISISISIASIEIKNVDITPNNPMIGRYSYAIVEVDFSSRDNLDYTQIMFDIPELNLHSVGNFHKKDSSNYGETRYILFRPRAHYQPGTYEAILKVRRNRETFDTFTESITFIEPDKKIPFAGIHWYSPAGVAYVGGEKIIDVVLKNEGDEDSYECKIVFGNSYINEKDTYRMKEPLKSGEETEIRLEIEIPEDAKSGHYDITARLECDNYEEIFYNDETQIINPKDYDLKIDSIELIPGNELKNEDIFSINVNLSNELWTIERNVDVVYKITSLDLEKQRNIKNQKGSRIEINGVKFLIPSDATKGEYKLEIFVYDEDKNLLDEAFKYIYVNEESIKNNIKEKEDQNSKEKNKDEFDQCKGCQFLNLCYDVSERFELNSQKSYCSTNFEITKQKPKTAVCISSFECESNLCNNGFCQNIEKETNKTIFQSFFEWISSIFN
jgi:hypothetical protein